MINMVFSNRLLSKKHDKQMITPIPQSNSLFYNNSNHLIEMYKQRKQIQEYIFNLDENEKQK